VTVIRKMKDGLYVQVRGSGSGPLESAVSVRESHTIPGERRAVSAGERVAAGPVPGRTGYFLVSKQAVTGELASGMLRRDPSLPPASSQVQLMCYEFGPYAAALAGLCPGFFEAAVTRTGAGAGEYWIHTLGGTLGSTKITPGELSGVQIQRGDFVVFYDDRDTSIHAAVATGDAQDVYSLWNRPEEFPVRVSIQSLCEPDDYWPVAYVKIAKLQSPDPGTRRLVRPRSRPLPVRRPGARRPRPRAGAQRPASPVRRGSQVRRYDGAVVQGGTARSSGRASPGRRTAPQPRWPMRGRTGDIPPCRAANPALLRSAAQWTHSRTAP
jgi:hypothetical protein